MEVGWPKGGRTIKGLVCMCYCMSMCKYSCMSVQVCMQSIASTLIFETGSLTGWELTEEARLANQPQGFSCLCLIDRHMSPCLAFTWVSVTLCSGPHADATDTLQMGPSQHTRDGSGITLLSVSSFPKAVLIWILANALSNCRIVPSSGL